MFVDRQEELAFLNRMLKRRRPGPGQLILLYGRRRVGKTELLKHWAQQSGVPFTYWAANKEPAQLQRRSFMATMMNLPEEQATPFFDSWPALWRWLGPRLAERQEQSILIIDELSYVSAQDPAVLSALQHAWDHHLKNANLVIVLCGSQITTMEAIMKHQSPLFGRFSGQWFLKPLPFYSLLEFFPDWSIEERIALYAIVGGVPAYLRWLEPGLSLSQNIQEVMLQSGSMFVAEPEWLLYDELHDLSTYRSILRAISHGALTLKAISDACLIGSSGLTFHLEKLQELRFVERRLPVTLTAAQQRRSKRGRYHLSNPFFRFYFRFIQPHLNSLLSTEETTAHIRRELRSYIGLAFEQLAQQWVVAQARGQALPFTPQGVGSHWSRRVQVDVVAINHETREILLGECKWGTEPVSRQVVRDLIEVKSPQLRRDLSLGDQWAFHFAVFSRAGLTPAAFQTLQAAGGLAVDLQDLSQGLDPPS
ncbi:MAG: ATP-binding protein [Ardenticatenaceae bacterium]|nr:ATP-binding protein [Ardenticatenaceae bacterium]